MKPLPPAYVYQEQLRDLEAAKQILALLVKLTLHGSRVCRDHIGWWEDYIKQREKELEDEQA